MHEANIASKTAQETLILFLSFYSDRVGAIPTRDHFFNWGGEVHKETTSLFVKMWILSECNSFHHIS